jgi:pimeloyl-ACP methyl ester carboxylesterase
MKGNFAIKWPLRLLATALVVYVGICFYMKWAQKQFLFKPVFLEESAEISLRSNEKEVWLAAEDGARVHGVLSSVPKARGAVLFLHGNAGNVQTSSAVHERFNRHQLDVLVIDYRGFGKSRGDLYEDGLHFDAEAGYLYLTGIYGEDSLVVYGQSLGSGIATRLSSRYRPRLLMLETPYTSLLEVAQTEYPWLPVSWLLDFPMDSKTYLSQAQSPTWIFHGTADEIIPFSMGEEMAKANTLTHFVSFQGVDHNGCNKQAAYHEALSEALNW